jgi:hypothetical protein
MQRNTGDIQALSSKMTAEEMAFDIQPNDSSFEKDLFGGFPSAYAPPSDMIGENPRIINVQKETTPPGYRNILTGAMIGLRPEIQSYTLESDFPTPQNKSSPFIKPKNDEDIINDRECKPILWDSNCDY